MPTANRVIAAAEGVEAEGSDLNTLQDRSILSLPACAWVYTYTPALPTNFQGATTLFGEYTIAPNTSKELDGSRDWRGREALWFCCGVVAANILPSGANHCPDSISDHQWISYNSKTGEALGANGWKPFAGADLYLYVINTDGHIYATNNQGGGGSTYYFYFMAQLTGTTT